MGEKRCKTTGTNRLSVIVVTAVSYITDTERRTVLQNCDVQNVGLSVLAN